MVADVTLNPCFFLSAPLIAPRTEWACHPVIVMRSSLVAPFLVRWAAVSLPSLVSAPGVGGDDFVDDLRDGFGSECRDTLFVERATFDFCGMGEGLLPAASVGSMPTARR